MGLLFKINKEQAKDRIFWIGFTAIIVSLTMTALTINFPNISDAVFYSVIIPMFVLLSYAFFLLWKFRKHIRWEKLPNIYRGND